MNCGMRHRSDCRGTLQVTVATISDEYTLVCFGCPCAVKLLSNHSSCYSFSLILMKLGTNVLYVNTDKTKFNISSGVL